MKFEWINWNNVFFKTYYEQQSIIQNLVHFDCIWLIHIALYWFYTACNSPKIYHQSNGLPPMPAMCWSFTMLGGAVLALVMILVTLAEFCIIPTTWNNTSHLTCQLLFLLTTLALTGGPLIYIFFTIMASKVDCLWSSVWSSLVWQLWLLYCSPSFPPGECLVTGWQASPRSTLPARPSWLVILLSVRTCIWCLLHLDSHLHVQVCGVVKHLGSGLCMNQVMITLAIMHVMDLMLFFLDTFLWYVIWSMVFNIAHLFTLGLSIWTPWNKIYSKLLATSDMEIKYKPKVILHYYCRCLGTHWALL